MAMTTTATSIVKVVAIMVIAMATASTTKAWTQHDDERIDDDDFYNDVVEGLTILMIIRAISISWLMLT